MGQTWSLASGCSGWLRQTVCHTLAGPPALSTAVLPAPLLPQPVAGPCHVRGPIAMTFWSQTMPGRCWCRSKELVSSWPGVTESAWKHRHISRTLGKTLQGPIQALSYIQAGGGGNTCLLRRASFFSCCWAPPLMMGFWQACRQISACKACARCRLNLLGLFSSPCPTCCQLRPNQNTKQGCLGAM